MGNVNLVLSRVTSVEEGIFLSPRIVSRLKTTGIDSEREQLLADIDRTEEKLTAFQGRVRASLERADQVTAELRRSPIDSCLLLSDEEVPVSWELEDNAGSEELM